MAKLANIKKGTRAVKPMPFRLADAPPQHPGDEADEHTMTVGLRVLTPGEIGLVYENAMADAQKAGVPQWLDTHPLCRLAEMVHTVALAAVDWDSPDRAEPFFVGGAETVRDHPGMGGDNLAYLYEQHRDWQDECGGRGAPNKIGDIIAMVEQEAGRPENAPGVPFSRLRPSAQRALWHSTAVLLWSLLRDKSEFSSLRDESLRLGVIASAKPESESQDSTPPTTESEP